MKLNLRSISFKILVPVFVILTTFTVILSNLVIQSVENHWLKNSQEVVTCDSEIVMNLMNRELEVTSAISSQVTSLYNSLYMASGKTSVSELFMKQLCDPVIKNHNMSYISIYDTNMNLISPAEYNQNGRKLDYVKTALKGSSTKLFRLENGKFEVVSVEPIMFSGQIIGAVEISKELSREDFMNRFPEAVGCEYAILSEDTILHSTFDTTNGKKISADKYDTILSGKPWCGVVKINDEDFMGYYWPYFRVEGLSFFVAESVESMNAATYRISSVLWFLQIVSGILILTIVVVLLFSFVLKPIKKTNEAIMNLSSGDADLTMRLAVRGHDEITQLSKGVNTFIELLQQMMKSIFEKSATVNEVISDLGSTAQETASSCTEIMANIEGVKNQAKNQSEAVGNTNSIILESNNYMSKLNDNIVAQTSDITESSAAIEQMIGNINAVTSSANKMSDSFGELTNLISEGSENVKACSEVIGQIEEKSKMLAEANKTIKTISSQTNLLAMNAMIESAHAGEAGKGFAVVAEEIRKLAENSSRQAGSIEENIKEIVNLISEGGRLSNLSQESFTTIDGQVNVVDPLVRQIAGAMEEQSSGSTQILESLGNMKNESLAVDDSSKQLNTEINRIKTDMDAVSQISDTILYSMDEMAAGSQQISRATQNVSDLALNTREAMNGINDLIGKFKV